MPQPGKIIFCLLALSGKAEPLYLIIRNRMKTITELFERSCTLFPENPYLWEKVRGKYRASSYTQVRGEVFRFAAALLSEGVQPGDTVALLSEGCNRWIYAELGILYAGAVNVPLSIKLTDNEIIFRIEHSRAKYLVVSSYFRARIKRIEARISRVQRIIVFGEAGGQDSRYLGYDDFLARGDAWSALHPDGVMERMRSVGSDDLVNISYTSGTTAEPKGIMLSHKNYVTNVLQADSLIRIPSSYKTLLLLPWDHSFAHTVGIYSFMYNGASLASVDFGNSPMEYLRNIPVNLKEVRPDVLLSVPSLAKNFKRNIETEIRGRGRSAALLYRWGIAVAEFYNGLGDNAGRGARKWVKPLVALFDRMLFSRIRESFGGKLKFFIGGGALLDLELQRYYAALGIPMYQGYGLSEAAPVISSNTPDAHRFGSSGKVVSPLDLKICGEKGERLSFGEKGEIWIKGDNVMEGYWQNEKNTKESIVGGWLRTGDLGYLEPAGWLYVLGRFKSLLISNDGEKYSPEGIEEAIVEASPWIDHCVLYNNQSPYTVALITLNVAVMKGWMESERLDPAEESTLGRLLLRLQEEWALFRAGGRVGHLFPERWLPAALAILPESIHEGNGLMNSSMKVVRGKVTERFRKELDYLFTPAGKTLDNALNRNNLRKLIG